MDAASLKSLLDQVAHGSTTAEEAFGRLRDLPFESCDAVLHGHDGVARESKLEFGSCCLGPSTDGSATTETVTKPL